MIYIGIDPGKSGAIAAVDECGLLFGECIKLAETDADIYAAFADMLSECDGARAIIEKVHSTPQMGVCSAFSFGRSLGFLYGLLTAMRIPFEEVSPQRWQKAMGCLTKGDKNISKARAQQLFPNTKCTHANADAMLLAEYWRRAWAEGGGSK